MPDRRSNSADHDLLVELRTEMKAVRQDIKDLKDNTTARIDDHEIRLRFVEKYVWGVIAIIGLINLIGFGFIISFLKN